MEIKTTVKYAKARKDRKAVVKWNAAAGADGYKVTYSTSEKFAKKKTEKRFVDANATSKTLQKLKAGKKYYVKVIPYKNIYNPNIGTDEKVYGKSTTKTFRAKK